MINFDLMSESNAVALCGTCHRNFDLACDPGFVFLPSDVSFFIHFEEEDYRRRCALAEQGITASRDCPTASMYRDHQAKVGLVSPDAAGGLYKRVIFKAFQPYLPQSVFNAEKVWHGAPMAALRRAFFALGSIRVEAFGPQLRDDLRILQDLYAREPPQTELHHAADTVNRSEELTRKRRADNEQSERTHKRSRSSQPSKSLQEATGAGYTNHTRLATSTPSYTNIACSAVQKWVLGPGVSSWEAAKRYQHLFTQDENLRTTTQPQ